jgi:hypothetical protein
MQPFVMKTAVPIWIMDGMLRYAVYHAAVQDVALWGPAVIRCSVPGIPLPSHLSESFILYKFS